MKALAIILLVTAGIGLALKYHSAIKAGNKPSETTGGGGGEIPTDNTSKPEPQ